MPVPTTGWQKSGTPQTNRQERSTALCRPRDLPRSVRGTGTDRSAEMPPAKRRLRTVE